MGAAPVLTVLKNGESIRSVPIEGEAVVGRGEGCVIRLEDRAISRQHAVFRSVGNGVQVEKKSEFAPLSVNGAECNQAVLKEGDVVSIGPYLLKLSLNSGTSGTSGASAQQAGKAALAEPSDLPILQSVAELAPDFEPAAGPAVQLAPPPSEGTPSVGALTPSDSPGLLEAPPEAGGLPGLDALNGVEGAGVPNFEEMPSDLPGLEVSKEVVASLLPPAAPEPVQLESGPAAAFSLAPPEENTAPTDTGPLADGDAATRIASPGKVEARLTIVVGAANVTEFDIVTDEITIGRGKDCDIVLNDRKVSRKNTVIQREGTRFHVRDQGSANGTYVNGVKVDDLPLASDDIIRIGDVEIRFSAMSKDYAAREPHFMAVAQEPTPATPLENLMPAYVEPPVSAPDAGAIAAVGAMPMAPVSPSGQAPQIPATATNPAGISFGAVPGIAGIGAGVPANASLIQKFRTLPPKRQAIWGFLILAFVWWFLDEDPVPPQPRKAGTVAQATAHPGADGKLAGTGAQAIDPVGAFQALKPAQKRAVDQWFTLAFDYYTNREYDKALFELKKIFELVPDYKNSRELERYAKEGKRQMEAREEEKRKAEEEARVRARITKLTQEIRDKMKSKQYEQAHALFSEVLTLDPDNADVAQFSRELEKFEEERRLAEQEKEIQKEVIERARDVYAGARRLKSHGKYHAAIVEYEKVLEIKPADRKLIGGAKAGIASSRAAIAALRDPLLADAKQAEESGELPKAYELYRKAAKVDPPNPAGWAGMDRIRGSLHERAKALYTEAVLAESYSDFATAKAKYKECLEVAPDGDVYHDRAQRKLGRFFGRDEASFQ